MLYVPGNDEKKILKTTSLDVDCVVLDCEDGVAVNKKKEARETIGKVLGSVQFGARTDVAVRVNSVGSGLADDDLECILEAKTLPSTIFLPKVESKDDVTWLMNHVQSELKDRKRDKHKFDLVLYVETALGLLNCREFLEHTKEMSEFTRVRLAGLVFGSDDFTANIGATRTKDAKEVLFARQQVVVLAKAFNIQAIDMVHIDYKDLKGLQEQSLEGASMGFTGKQVIHPGQVPVVQEAFSPSPEQLDRARRMVAEFEKHQKEGKGAFTFEGSMIDMPTVLQATNLVEADRAIHASRETKAKEDNSDDEKDKEEVKEKS